LPHDFKSLDELLDSADHALFRVIVRSPHHVLHPLLPTRKRTVLFIYTNCKFLCLFLSGIYSSLYIYIFYCVIVCVMGLEPATETN